MNTPLSYRDATDHIARLHSQADHRRLLRRVDRGVVGRRRNRTEASTGNSC